jgi:hypothetical protein
MLVRADTGCDSRTRWALSQNDEEAPLLAPQRREEKEKPHQVVRPKE